MQIKSLSFHDVKTDWRLEKTCFDSMNLLVGISGVGKTRIINALNLIKKVATSKKCELNGIEWKICFIHQYQEYVWELKSALVADSSPGDSLSILLEEKEDAKITFEKITNVTKQTVVIERSEKAFEWNGEEIVPKLRRTESVITLLAGEEGVIPIHQAFESLINLEIDGYASAGFLDKSGIADLDKVTLRDENDELLDLKKFKEKTTGLSMLLRAYFLQKFFQGQFEEIKNDYIEIFPFVEDVKVFHARVMNNSILFFGVKEHGSNNWIYQKEMSSGMFRALAHLVEISLAPEGTVILIDEFENSLGINCMPGLTDIVLRQAPKLQYIITSHHPYTINKIPWQRWKLVHRRNRQVKVVGANTIPQLQTSSKLDKFIQLINLPHYEEGIA